MNDKIPDVSGLRHPDTYTSWYIAEVTRRVPARQRDDIAEELWASISDQVEARALSGVDPEDAEWSVLSELGDPVALAAQYADRPLHLVGPRFYPTWRRLVVVLLWSVLPALGVAVALGQVIAGAHVGQVIGTVLVTVQLTALHLLFWTTLVFALIERSGPTGADAVKAWTVDDLRRPADDGAGRAELIATTVFLALLAGAVVWDRFIGFVPGTDGPLPLLHPGLWPWGIAGLFAIMAVEVVVAFAVYRRGRWTVPLAVVQALLGLAIGAAALWLHVSGQLVNPEWIATVLGTVDAEARRVLGILVAFVIAGVFVWGAIDPFVKARRAARVGPGGGAE
ncbi:permease prefix domain 1-containing protein [Microbacterium album]|uniref:LigA protein n=1 Tax=Microbacterium album TaxID=2053191 RepID=A0A917ID26_9MICO|nr:permease prefix domain 1-containing protein [Microbacterium album]GGH36346.1 hypothetical protein GCM10010921_05430 [Microbacterium album]